MIQCASHDISEVFQGSGASEREPALASRMILEYQPFQVQLNNIVVSLDFHF